LGLWLKVYIGLGIGLGLGSYLFNVILVWLEKAWGLRTWG